MDSPTSPTPPATPPRRRRLPRAERERAMLDAAGSAFATRGFHGASMDAIAEAAGISKPMLYSYFGSKDGLYAAFVARAGDALLHDLRHAAPRDAAPRERMRAGVVAYLAYAEAHRSGWKVLFSEAADQGGGIAAGLTGLRARLAELLVVPLGGEAAAHAFVGAAETLANWWLDHPEMAREDVAGLLMRIAEAASDHVAGT